MKPAQDINVKAIQPLISPAALKVRFPMDEKINETVVNTRDAIQKIMTGEDKRKLAIVGPCSIHDTDLALDYAKRLATLREELSDRLLIVMRVYFEKPRTTIGWRGLIYDPDLDGSENLQKGMEKARKLLIDINELGLPCATELLDPVTPQYISDLISWSCIGARTTESQTHRDMASGLSMPVGFKNSHPANRKRTYF